jgi:hypothetical protein
MSDDDRKDQTRRELRHAAHVYHGSSKADPERKDAHAAQLYDAAVWYVLTNLPAEQLIRIGKMRQARERKRAA